MNPIAEKLYKDDPEKRKQLLSRHLGFYNCEPVFGASINGLSVAMEEQMAAGKDISAETVTSVKTGLMGPLAGIGDSVMQGAVFPLLLAFVIDLTLQGNTIVPAIVYAIAITILQPIVSHSFFMMGYKRGSNAILSFLESGVINRLISGANILGCMVIGTLVAHHVRMNIGIEILQYDGSVFSIQQDLLDTILPGLLPLLLTLGCYALIKKGWTAIKVLLLIVAVGLVGSLTGILG